MTAPWIGISTARVSTAATRLEKLDSDLGVEAFDRVAQHYTRHLLRVAFASLRSSCEEVPPGCT
jgi:hypothetical protein